VSRRGSPSTPEKHDEKSHGAVTAEAWVLLETLATRLSRRWRTSVDTENGTYRLRYCGVYSAPTVRVSRSCSRSAWARCARLLAANFLARRPGIALRKQDPSCREAIGRAPGKFFSSLKAAGDPPGDFLLFQGGRSGLPCDVEASRCGYSVRMACASRSAAHDRPEDDQDQHGDHRGQPG
jgi:hypothetical protein